MTLTRSEQRIVGAAHDWFELHRDEFVKDLVAWVAIPSVSDESLAAPGAPFGPEVARVFALASERAAELDLTTVEHDGYAMSVLLGDQDSDIGLISHLDVVPAGEGWIHEPYIPFEKDGYVIGRGVRDNKGAALLDLYLLRFLRHEGLPLRHRIRVIYGGAEETGMADMQYFVDHEQVPAVSLVTDGFFPVNNIQLGRLSAQLFFPSSPELSKWRAGDATNSVPSQVSLTIPGECDVPALRAAAELWPSDHGSIVIESNGASATVQAHGTSGHSAFPSGTVNALSSLTSFVSAAKVLDGQDARSFELLAKFLESPHGEAVGVAQSDEESGALTLNGGLVEDSVGGFILHVNIRYPLSADPSAITAQLQSVMDTIGGDLLAVEDVPPHHIPADDPTVELLRAVFDDATGATTQPMAMGGGTHARLVPNAHTFGPGLWTEEARPYAARPPAPFLPVGHGNPHGPDECVSIDNLRVAFGLYVLAILRLDAATP
jgi:succinyl-diaminopimelate desuccinylase